MPNDTSTEAFMLIDYAQNWQDFRKALSLFVTPTQNFVYADTDGNIGYQMAGHIPIRSGWTGVLPVKADGEHQWDGFIPFDQLPYVYNLKKDLLSPQTIKSPRIIIFIRSRSNGLSRLIAPNALPI